MLTCCDADRLDLDRVGIRPLPERLCTAVARQPVVLEWAYRRSLGWPAAINCASILVRALRTAERAQQADTVGPKP
ncbi:hypothetical protein O4H66_19430 [Comamonadaceae bacterium G21597-S1]|nr:hypothetical protein [Comamonadaceae bacterium G21597-S1]